MWKATGQSAMAKRRQIVPHCRNLRLSAAEVLTLFAVMSVK
jgi:hypothetical protein